MEAQIAAKVWTGNVLRWWDDALRPKPLEGQALEDHLGRLAGKFPQNVKVH